MKVDTADMILEEEGKVLLVKRGKEPFKGQYALPGGHLEEGETLEDAAKREMEEETGLKVGVKELLDIYYGKERDPRGKVVTTAFIVEKIGGRVSPGGDAAEVSWFRLDDLPELGFDHAEILQDYKDSR